MDAKQHVKIIPKLLILNNLKQANGAVLQNKLKKEKISKQNPETQLRLKPMKAKPPHLSFFSGCHQFKPHRDLLMFPNKDWNSKAPQLNTTRIQSSRDCQG